MEHDLSRRATPEELEDILRSPVYAPWTLKEYEHWSLRLNITKQELPGRSTAWLKRHVDQMSLAELTKEELHELVYTIIPEFTDAMRSWLPLRTLNVEWLGNETKHHRGHGHMHFTPRLDAPLTFNGREYVDLTPTTRKSNPRLTLSEEELRPIFEHLKGLLNN
ncbi:MAG TPA: hypothetical protein VEA36_02095 [Candidatus Paceibacterota bacterium]|nr:hypothetical protein [Candidatus Paceibacterota bacterium]